STSATAGRDRYEPGALSAQSSARSTCTLGSSSTTSPPGCRSLVVVVDMTRSRRLVRSIGVGTPGVGSGLLPRLVEGLGLLPLLLRALLQGLDRPADAASATLPGRAATRG